MKIPYSAFRVIYGETPLGPFLSVSTGTAVAYLLAETNKPYRLNVHTKKPDDEQPLEDFKLSRVIPLDDEPYTLAGLCELRTKLRTERAAGCGLTLSEDEERVLHVLLQNLWFVASSEIR